MEAEFWRRKWRDRELGWHQSKAHPMLVRHLAGLGLAPGARIFVPLCGKTLDIGWLLEAGFRVAGAELVETAVEELFSELGATPRVSGAGRLKRHAADGLDVFAGDLFDLDVATLGPVDAVYDRAALVALPADTRKAYAAHLPKLTGVAPQLAVTFDYDQSVMAGPPFSVTEAEVRILYGGRYDVELLESAELPGGLKGVCPSLELALRLTPRQG